MTTPKPLEKTSGFPPINLREFRDEGLLQEVNRRFFHVLGLMLVLTEWPDHPEKDVLTVVATNDPAGVHFDTSEWNGAAVEVVAKAQRVAARLAAAIALRRAQPGFEEDGFQRLPDATPPALLPPPPAPPTSRAVGEKDLP